MDRKSIIVVVGCIALLIGWQFVIVPKLTPPAKPLPPGATNQPATAQSAAPTNGSTATPSTAAAVKTVPRPATNTNAPEELLVLTNNDSLYVFTSHGGGLKTVELTQYPETIASRRSKTSSTHGVATLNTHASVPTLAIYGDADLEDDGVFKLTRTANGVRAEKQLSSGLTVVKEFTPGSNYLLNATVRIENHSDRAVSLSEQEWIVGTATPMDPQDSGMMEGMMWSDGDKARDTLGGSYFSTRGFACMPRTPPSELRAGQTNIAWAAAHNQFFALAVVPKHPAEQVVMRKVELPQFAIEDKQSVSTNGYEVALVYPAMTLTATQTVERQFVIFAGPKEYKTLARVASELNNNLDAIMAFGWTGFFAKALLLGMNWLHAVTRIPYGYTIVAITVLIKLVFWPLTASSTRSMKKMQALSPQVKALQEKYKDDPMKLQRKTMELWKENKVNPMGGCLPMVIQMPVFIGFYTMLRSAIELRGASFLWIADLSKPDTLFYIPNTHIPFNLLPLLMIGAMLWQSHMTPVSPGVDPAQQKMMRYMPLMFLVFFYNYSAGMALYWTTNTVLGIIQTRLTKTDPNAPATPASPALTPQPKKKK